MNKRILIYIILLGALAYWGYLQTVSLSGTEVLGEEGKPFVVKDENGKLLHSEDLKGTVFLLHFWATWCPPCAAEIPALEYFQKSFEGLPFRLVAVSQDDKQEDVVPFRKKVPFTFPVYFDHNGDVANSFGTYRLPETYLIDTKGKIVEKFIGPQDWSQYKFRRKILDLLPAK